MAQSHVYIVQTLKLLESNVNNKEDDESSTLKQAMHCSDCLKWKTDMQAKYDSHIENEIFKLTLIPENRQVITNQWYLKLKKNWYG